MKSATMKTALKRLTRFRIVYLISVHILIIVLLFKTDAWTIVKTELGFPASQVNPFYQEILAYHRRIDANLKPGSILFIGDSQLIYSTL